MFTTNWVRRTSWGWWDEWGVTALQTQDSKLSPVGLRPSTPTLGHNIQYLRLNREETFCFLETWMPEQETNPRSLTFLAGTRAPRPSVLLLHIYIQTHCLWIYYRFTVRGAAQHFSYFILHNMINVHNIYWSCHCYPLPVIIDSYVFTLVLP